MGYKENYGNIGAVEFYGCDGVIIGATDNLDGYKNTGIMASNSCNLTSDYLYNQLIYINGYNDWYIPAVDEILNLIQTIPEFSSKLDTTETYWTSTEADDIKAFGIIFNPFAGGWVASSFPKTQSHPFLGVRKQIL